MQQRLQKEGIKSSKDLGSPIKGQYSLANAKKACQWESS